MPKEYNLQPGLRITVQTESGAIVIEYDEVRRKLKITAPSKVPIEKITREVDNALKNAI